MLTCGDSRRRVGSTRDLFDGTREFTSRTLATYTYDERGLRVREESEHLDEAGNPLSGTDPLTKAQLFDAMNPTGYAQAVEEFEVVAAAPESWVRTRSTGILVHHGWTTVNGLHARYRIVVDSHDGTRVISIFPALSE